MEERLHGVIYTAAAYHKPKQTEHEPKHTGIESPYLLFITQWTKSSTWNVNSSIDNILTTRLVANIFLIFGYPISLCHFHFHFHFLILYTEPHEDDWLMQTGMLFKFTTLNEVSIPNTAAYILDTIRNPTLAKQ